MLKKLFTSLWLLCFVSAACAQEDDNKSEGDDENKRPSWSAGLPERQKPAELSKPTFEKPEMDNEIELDMSEFGLQPKPEIEMELPINSGIDGLPVGNAKEQAEQAAAEQAAAEQAAAEQAAAEQAAAEQAAAEQAAAEQAAAEQAAAEQAAAEQAAAEQAAAEQAAAEQAAAEQAAAEQAAAEQAAAEQAAAEQAAAEQVVAEEQLIEEEPLNTQAENNVSEEASLETAQDSNPLTDEQNTDSLASTSSEELSPSISDQTEYSWKIIERKPVNYPTRAAIDKLEGWVDVEITINPAGEVVSASAVDFSRRGRVFANPAIQSVNGWLFEPPSNMGISDNITRVYKVEFEL